MPKTKKQTDYSESKQIISLCMMLSTSCYLGPRWRACCQGWKLET